MLLGIATETWPLAWPVVFTGVTRFALSRQLGTYRPSQSAIVGVAMPDQTPLTLAPAGIRLGRAIKLTVGVAVGVGEGPLVAVRVGVGVAAEGQAVPGPDVTWNALLTRLGPPETRCSS